MNPRDQLMLDLFTTALEGGIGYWSQCGKYKHLDAEMMNDPSLYFAIIREMGDDDESEASPEWIINHSVMRAGYHKATAGWRDKLNWSADKPPIVVDEDTDWDYDAGDADMIVQLGLFGEVRYG